MSSSLLTIKIAGPAGAGIKSSGLLLSKILLSHGFSVKDYSEYPSLVRGGHNTYQVTFSDKEFFSPHFNVDYFFSLIPGHWQQHKSEFSKNSLVFGDDAPLKLSLREFSGQLGSTIYVNTICIGAAVYLLNLSDKLCRQIVADQFGKDSPNLSAFDLGYEFAQNNFSKNRLKTATLPKTNSQNIYDGSEAFGWGFIKAGGNFYAAYPMTPASGALHFLAQKQTEHKLQVLHPEDEIAAASLCAGAAFAGARASVGTSGGGFALMTETVSFAGAANLGIVFYLVSRPGPATGLPTWTSQGDLLFAVHSGHGEFNKIVLAPGDQSESFDLAAASLNLAAKYNLPVILLSDKFIAESAVSLPDLSKKTVKVIKSSLPAPGTPDKEYMANSYEHDGQGFATEDPVIINKNVLSRRRQLKSVLASVPKPTFYFGSKKSTTLIVTWGSVKSTVWEALRILNNPDIAHLHFQTLWPLDPKIEYLFKPFKKVIVVENNANSQFTSLLKSQFNFQPTETILKYDGRPFFPEELVKKLKTIC